MKYLGCLFVLFFLLFIPIVAAVRMVFRVLSGTSSSARHGRPGPGREREPSSAGKGNTPPKKSGKIFGKDEGEYVDFEEIPKK